MAKLLPELDDQPKNDYWAPEVAELEATPEELEAGNRLGQSINVDDDEDNGGVE